MASKIKINVKGFEKLSDLQNRLLEAKTGIKKLFNKRINREIRTKMFQDNKKEGYRTKRSEFDKNTKVYSDGDKIMVSSSTRRRFLSPEDKNVNASKKGIAVKIKRVISVVKNPKLFFMAKMKSGHSGFFTRYHYGDRHKLIDPKTHNLFSKDGTPRNDKRFTAKGKYSKKYKVTSRTTLGRSKISEMQTISFGNELRKTYSNPETVKRFGKFMFSNIETVLKKIFK